MAADVGAVEEFDDALIRVVTVNAREVGVLRWRDDWYAFRNICPHLGARICAGALHACVEHEGGWDGNVSVRDDRPVLMCPWHRWEFDVQSGQSLLGDERLKTYSVAVADGRVLVELPDRGSGFDGISDVDPSEEVGARA